MPEWNPPETAPDAKIIGHCHLTWGTGVRPVKPIIKRKGFFSSEYEKTWVTLEDNLKVRLLGWKPYPEKPDRPYGLPTRLDGQPIIGGEIITCNKPTALRPAAPLPQNKDEATPDVLDALDRALIFIENSEENLPKPNLWAAKNCIRYAIERLKKGLK